MLRREFVGLVTGSAAGLVLGDSAAGAQQNSVPMMPSIQQNEGHAATLVLPGQREASRIDSSRILLNSGGGTTYGTPVMLAESGYNSVVVDSVGLLQMFDAVSPGLIPGGSPERAWAEEKIAAATAKIREAHKAGLTTYSSFDIIVFPKRLIAKYADEICDTKGHIDIMRPKTQELFRAQMRELFRQFPDLVVRGDGNYHEWERDVTLRWESSRLLCAGRWPGPSPAQVKLNPTTEL